MTTPDSESRIGRADQDQAVRLERLAEAGQRRFDVGHVLDHVVADHEIETVGREAIGLDVAEDRFLRVIVVADLVLVDIDHGDVGAAQHVERQEAGRAAAGLVDREAGRGQRRLENAVNGQQALPRLAGRQIEQRLRMRRGRLRPAAPGRASHEED